MLHVNFHVIEKVNSPFSSYRNPSDFVKFLTKSSSLPGKRRANPNAKCMGLRQAVSTFWFVVSLCNPTGKNKQFFYRICDELALK